MSSNSSIRKLLIETLKEGLPQEWHVTSIDEYRQRATKSIVCTVEQGDIVSEIQGRALPPGTIGLQYNVTLWVPEQDTNAAIDRVMPAAFDLIQYIDTVPWTVWESGQRGLDADLQQHFYQFPLTILHNHLISEEN